MRAANARILIEQSIGRGLRLPYGTRTGVTAVDRLNIVAHDKFQEIIDEASKPDSAIRLQTVILGEDQLQQKPVTVVSQSKLESQLGIKPPHSTSSTVDAGADETPVFETPQEEKIAQLTFDIIKKYENQPKTLPSVTFLQKPKIQAKIAKEVEAQYRPIQQEFEEVSFKPDIQAIVAKTLETVIRQTIDIPRILVVPRGESKCGFKPFTLKLDSLRYPAVSEELWIQHLRTNDIEILSLGRGGFEENRLEDYIVSGLVDFDDISYDDHADYLYELASQTVQHFLSYLSEEDTRKVLRCYQREIAKFIHAQMQEHYWEEAEGYEVKVTKGFSPLKPSAYSESGSNSRLDYRQSPSDKSNMAKYLFTGFQRCLYPVQKFDAEGERKLAVILEREALKWFKPAKGQFQIYYKKGGDHLEYQPDFVAETVDSILMLEPKARNMMDDADVLAKQEAAVQWCQHATNHAETYGGNPWRYALIPHDEIAENITLHGLVKRYGQ